MNSVIETVQKPIEDRGWVSDGFYRNSLFRRGDSASHTREEVEELLKIEDQPMLIAEIERLESVLEKGRVFVEKINQSREWDIEFWVFESALNEKTP